MTEGLERASKGLQFECVWHSVGFRGENMGWALPPGGFEAWSLLEG